MISETIRLRETLINEGYEGLSSLRVPDMLMPS